MNFSSEFLFVSKKNRTFANEQIVTVMTTTLNSAQRTLLNMLSTVNTEEDLIALRQLLVKFLDEKLQREMDKLYADGLVSESKIEKWGNQHLRTPYNP